MPAMAQKVEAREPSADAAAGGPRPPSPPAPPPEPPREDASETASRSAPAPAPAPEARSVPPSSAPLESLSARDEPIPHAPPSARPWRSYKEILAALAQRVLDAQRPI